MTRTVCTVLALVAALSFAAGTAAATPSSTPLPGSASAEQSPSAARHVSTFVLLDAATGKVLRLVELPSGHAPR